jgi:exonuclease VII small subunit
MAKDQSAELSYEAAKSQLDEIVTRLEDKDLPLDDMVNGAKARLEALRPSKSDED